MLDSIKDAIEDIRLGKMVIVIDNEDRENEGDLVFAAEKADSAKINFMATHARGLICCPISRERARQLKLPLMVEDNSCQYQTAFTVSVDAKDDTTTGISAEERAISAYRLSNTNYQADDFIRPGHIFPLIAVDGGIKERIGHTEAAVELATLAGLSPAGVICEIMNEDGTMARLPELRRFASRVGTTHQCQ